MHLTICETEINSDCVSAQVVLVPLAPSSLVVLLDDLLPARWEAFLEGSDHLLGETCTNTSTHTHSQCLAITAQVEFANL